MTSLRVQALRSLRAVEPFRAEINALNLASRRPCPFSTFEYVRTFLEHDEYGAREDELLFLAAFDDETLVGYLPLRKHRAEAFHLPFHKVDVLVSHDTDRPHVVSRPKDETLCSQAFYRWLLEHERGWSFLELAMQDAESKLVDVPRLNPLRFYARRSETMPNTTVPLPYASLAEYFESIAHGQRKNMARLARRLIGAGHAEVVSSSDAPARGPLLGAYLDLESRSWKERAHAGIRRDPRRIELFRALCEPEQPLAIGFDFVVLDELPIAGILTGSFAGTTHGIEMCFDAEYEDLGPGHLLTLMTMRRAIESGQRAFNFNGNYAYYKAKVGGVVTETSAVQIYKVGTVPWLKARAGDVKRRLRPPEDEEERFNAEKRRAVGEPEAKAKTRSPRVEERARWRAILAQLESEHASFERLSGAALERVLPFSSRKEAA